MALAAGLVFVTVAVTPGWLPAGAMVGSTRPPGHSQPAAHPAVAPAPAPVTACGRSLCAGPRRWVMYGATIYNPGLTPDRSGIRRPGSTVALARRAHLNTIRITDFLGRDGPVATAPYDEAAWRRVDVMIADAGASGMHVDLGLADYRNMMWNNCEDPYRANWSRFIDFVAHRVNTVTGRIYSHDPTIALISIAGEPLQIGAHSFRAAATNRPCTIAYSAAQLTRFYASTLGEWAATRPTVMLNTGGLGYLNESNSGIAWRSIMALPDNPVCDIKTYGGMAGFAATVARYCARIGKPLIDEEFGWTQAAGDAARARAFTGALARLKSIGVAGVAFWNLGYQQAATSYDVGPGEPLTWAAVRTGRP